MMGLAMDIENELTNLSHRIPTAALIGGSTVVGGAALGGIALAAHSYRTRRSKSARTHRKISHIHRKIKGRRYTPHTAGKRRDTSRRRIRYTSKGQPYVLKANGQAKFIKSRSARSSHKRKGGRY
jgi:hypothetical protein